MIMIMKMKIMIDDEKAFARFRRIVLVTNKMDEWIMTYYVFHATDDEFEEFISKL